MEYGADQDVWFECIFDARTGRYSWALLPPVAGEEPDSSTE